MRKIRCHYPSADSFVEALASQTEPNSLQAFSSAQNVKLAYNEDGQLVDRGEVAGAQAIMSLLVNDWGWAVNQAELNPSDPLVNTATEYMYQMATIAYHTLHSTQTVTIAEDTEFNGCAVGAWLAVFSSAMRPPV